MNINKQFKNESECIQIVSVIIQLFEYQKYQNPIVFKIVIVFFVTLVTIKVLEQLRIVNKNFQKILFDCLILLSFIIFTFSMTINNDFNLNILINENINIEKLFFEKNQFLSQILLLNVFAMNQIPSLIINICIGTIQVLLMRFESSQQIINIIILIIIHYYYVIIDQRFGYFEAQLKIKDLICMQIIKNKKYNYNSIRKCIEEIQFLQNNYIITDIVEADNNKHSNHKNSLKKSNNLLKTNSTTKNIVDSKESGDLQKLKFQIKDKDKIENIKERGEFQTFSSLSLIKGIDMIDYNTKSEINEKIEETNEEIENKLKISSDINPPNNNLKGINENSIDILIDKRKGSNDSVKNSNSVSLMSKKISKKYSINRIDNKSKLTKISEISRNSKFSNKVMESRSVEQFNNNNNSLDNFIMESNKKNNPAKRINDLKLLADSEIDDMEIISLNIQSYMLTNLKNFKNLEIAIDKSPILIDELITSFNSSHSKSIEENKINLIFRISEGLDYSFQISRSTVKMIINIFINNSIVNSVNCNFSTILVNFKKYSKEEMNFFSDFIIAGKFVEAKNYFCISVIDSGNKIDKNELKAMIFKDISQGQSKFLKGETEMPTCRELAMAIDCFIFFNTIDDITTNFTLCIPIFDRLKKASKFQKSIQQITTDISFQTQQLKSRHLCNGIIIQDEYNKGSSQQKALKSNSIPHKVFNTRIDLLKQINEQLFNLCIRCPKMIVLIVDTSDMKTLFSIRMLDLDNCIKVHLLGAQDNENLQDGSHAYYDEEMFTKFQFNIYKENEEKREEQELKMTGLLYEDEEEIEKPTTRFEKALVLAKENRNDAFIKAKERQVKKESHQN